MALDAAPATRPALSRALTPQGACSERIALTHARAHAPEQKEGEQETHDRNIAHGALPRLWRMRAQRGVDRRRRHRGLEEQRAQRPVCVPLIRCAAARCPRRPARWWPPRRPDGSARGATVARARARASASSTNLPVIGISGLVEWNSTMPSACSSAVSAGRRMVGPVSVMDRD